MSDIFWVLLLAALVAAYVTYVIHLYRRKPEAPPESPPIPVLTDHARQRMAQRNVGLDKVEAVLAAPDRVEFDPKEDSHRLERNFDGAQTVRVWVVQWPAPHEVRRDGSRVRKAVVKTVAQQYRITVKVPVDRVGQVIGRGGATIRSIEQRSDYAPGVRIRVDRTTGEVHIKADTPALAQAARVKVLAAAGL